MYDSEPHESKHIFAKIRNRIIGGLFIVIPLVVTVWITIIIYDNITQWSLWVAEKIPYLDPLRNEFWYRSSIRFSSIILILVVLFLIGQLAKYTIGRNMIYLTEKVLLKVPLLNTVYSTLQQMGEALWSPKGGMFRKVVLFEYPRKGLFVIGFVTNENKGDWELKRKTDKDLISVFLPTTPNPTSGFLLFVPREDCIFLDMDVKQGMRLVISGGAVSGGKGAGDSQVAPAVAVSDVSASSS